MPGLTVHGQLLMEPVLDDKKLLTSGVNAQDNLGYENMQSLAEATTQSTDSLKNNSALMKEFGNIMPEIIKNLRYMNSVVAQTGQSLPSIKKQLTTEEQRKKRKSDLIDQGALSFINNGNGVIQSYANGNVGGAASGIFSSVSNLANNGAKLAENAEKANFAKSLAKMGIVTAIAGTVVKGADTLANKYIDEMPTIFGTGRAFGDMSNEGAMISYQALNEKNRGTNLSINEFQTIAQSLRQQGVGNGLGRDAQLDLVGNIAARTGQLAYITGGDANQYANLAGLMSRYGGSTDVAGDFERIIASGRASGLNDTQLPEFLNAIQKVMEDGIAKGFNRSATEVASTMLMFSKMSNNNPFWQGEQGARIINQANNGLTSATGLSKTSDIIAYRAIARAYKGKEESSLGDLYLNDGDYVNNMMLMEKGLTPENFGSIMDAIGETAPNTAGKIERIRQMFGLNYTGATRLMKLNRDNFNSDEDFQKELDKIKNDPEMQNNETRNQAAMNEIKAAVVNVGEGLANMKIEGMDKIASGVSNIEKWLGMDYKARADEKEAAEIMDSLDSKKMSIVFSNMKYYGDKKNGLDRLRSLATWNEFGRIPGIVDDNIFEDYTPAPDYKSGETEADMVGAWALDNNITYKNMEEFITEAWGPAILNKKGDPESARKWIKALSNPKNTNSYVKEIQDMIGKYSVDRIYTKNEQEDTLTKILNLLRSGIDINYTK